MARGRANPGVVERLLFEIATRDGNPVRIGFGKAPGQGGKSQARHLARALDAFTATPATESGDKIARFGRFSSLCRAGNMNILRGPCYEELFRVLEGFPDLAGRAVAGRTARQTATHPTHMGPRPHGEWPAEHSKSR